MSKKNKKIEEKTKEEVRKEEIPQEVEDYKNKYLHLLADQENLRKRLQKDKEEMIRHAKESTIKDFLPIIDNFENALKFAQKSTSEVQSWAMGFQMILSQLQDILHGHGIVSYHSIGNQFDPLFHEAVEIVETSDQPDRMILEEFAKGYKCHNRTLRPAKVKVTKKPSIVEPLSENKEEVSEKPLECEKTKESLEIEGQNNLNENKE